MLSGLIIVGCLIAFAALLGRIGHKWVERRSCNNCGQQLPTIAKFCPRCGGRIKKKGEIEYSPAGGMEA
jgi:rRNA maturation endonuclease Nob1